jgi:hypothetical protein
VWNFSSGACLKTLEHAELLSEVTSVIHIEVHRRTAAALQAPLACSASPPSLAFPSGPAVCATGAEASCAENLSRVARFMAAWRGRASCSPHGRAFALAFAFVISARVRVRDERS